MADEEVSCGCGSSSNRFYFSRNLIVYFGILSILIEGITTQNSIPISNFQTDGPPIFTSKKIDDIIFVKTLSSNKSSTTTTTTTTTISTSSNLGTSKAHDLISSISSSGSYSPVRKMTSKFLTSTLSNDISSTKTERQTESTNFIVVSTSPADSGSSTLHVATSILNNSSSIPATGSSSIEISIHSNILPTFPSSITASSIHQNDNNSSSIKLVNVSSTDFASLVLPSCYVITTTEVICSTPSSAIMSSSDLPNKTSADIVSTDILHTSTVQPTMISTEVLSTSSNLSTTILSSTESINPSVSSSAFVVSSSINASVLLPSVHVCDVVAGNFTIALNNYTSCILFNLKPMEVCFKCFEQYETLKLFHRKIYHDCGKHLIGRYNSQYQVIARLFDIQQQSWQSLGCESEFDFDVL